MKILESFYKLIDSLGIDEKAIHEDDGDGFKLLVFPEEGEPGIMYSVALVFYDNDDDAEIYVRKPVSGYDELTMFRKLNELNCEYSDVVFLIDEGNLSVKTFVSSGGEIEPVMKKLLMAMKVAQTEFPNI